MKKYCILLLLLVIILMVSCDSLDDIKLPVETTEDVVTEIVTNEGLKLIEINDVSVELIDLIQKDGILEIHYVITNNTKKEIETCESLAKVVDGDIQQEYDLELNMNNYLTDNLEPGVKKESVLLFKEVEHDEINILIKVNYEPYRFNKMEVTKK